MRFGHSSQGGLSSTRDNSGNPLEWGDIAGLYTRVYAYDKNSRLDSVTYPGHPVEGFACDWVGNRGLPGRPVGKSIWNDGQMATRAEAPGELQLIYENPKERLALKAIMPGKSYADLFPRDLLMKECPCLREMLR